MKTSGTLAAICTCTLLFGACDAMTGMKTDESTASSSTQAVMQSSAGDATTMQPVAVPASQAMERSSEPAASAPAEAGVYAALTENVIGNGRTSVLFFHAAWCPKCKTVDAYLSGLYANTPPAISVYKIDYDSEVALKRRYGVVQQHTFVKIDGQGNVIDSKSFPTDADLSAFLR